MKFTIPQDVLAEALGAPTRTANTRATTQAVGGVLIQTDGANGIVLSATNGTTTVKVAAVAAVELPGMVLLPARTLYACVRALDDDVTIETDGNRARITSGRYVGSLKVLPAGNFPAFPLASGQTIDVKPEYFVQAVAQVAPAASKDETRGAITGIKFTVAEGVLVLAATDAVRVGVCSIPCAGAVTAEGVLDYSTVMEVQRAAVGNVLSITFTEDGVQFHAPRFKLATELLKGKYPEYEKIIPERLDGYVSVSRPEFLGALRRVSLIGDNAPIKLSKVEEGLKLEVVALEVGEADETINAEGHGFFSMAFTPKYLIDGVEAVHSGVVEIGFTSEHRPIRIRGFQDDGFKYVLMPVRIQKPVEA